MQQASFVVHIVDPDAAIADGLSTLLSTYGIDVIAYPDAESFLQSRSAALQQRGCLLVEADLPGVSGPALLQQVHDQLAVVLLVSTSSPDLIDVASSSSRVRVIEKPCVDGALVDALLSIRQQA
ncbi:MAG: response regulator [Woeseiaceae bacterium]